MKGRHNLAHFVAYELGIHSSPLSQQCLLTYFPRLASSFTLIYRLLMFSPSHQPYILCGSSIHIFKGLASHVTRLSVQSAFVWSVLWLGRIWVKVQEPFASPPCEVSHDSIPNDLLWFMRMFFFFYVKSHEIAESHWFLIFMDMLGFIFPFPLDAARSKVQDSDWECIHKIKIKFLY